MRRSWLVILLLCVQGCGADKQQQIDSLVNQGEALVSRYEFAAARKIFAQIGEIDASSPYSLFGEGLVLEQYSQYYDALDDYMTVNDGQPQFAPALLGQYRIFWRLGDYEEAVKVAGRLAELQPNDPQAQMLVARAMARMGQYVRARNIVDEAVDKGLDRVKADLIKAHSYWLQNQFDSAVSTSATALNTLGDDPLTLDLAADLLEEMGLIDSALVLSRRSVEVSGKEHQYLEEHFYRALRHKCMYEARHTIDLLPATDTVNLAAVMLRLIYHTNGGEHSEAIKARGDFLLYGQETLSLYFYGMFTVQPYGDYPTIMEEVTWIRETMYKGKWLKAFVDYMDYVLASKLVTRMEENDNLKALSAVRPPRSNRIEVRQGRALMYQRTGRFDEAKDAVDQMQTFHSTQPEWLTGTADLVTDHAFRWWDKAADLYEKALGLDSCYRPAFQNWVAMYEQLNQYDRALSVINRYPHLTRIYPVLAVRKAIVLVHTGDVRGGTDLFMERIGPVSSIVSLWEEMVAALRSQSAEDCVDRLAALIEQVGSANPDLLVLAADLNSDRGEYQHGQQLAEKALTIEPGSLDASAEKARAMFFLGQKEEALAILADNFSKKDLHRRNSYWYSRLLASQELQLDLAMNVARAAMFNAGTDVETWCNLAYVYYQAAQLQMAAGEARNISQKFPDLPEPQFRWGMALYMMNDPAAKEHLKKAISLGLKGDDLIQAQQVLAKL